MTDKWLLETSVFKHPFTSIISGPTGSGKTTFLKNLLIYKNILIKPQPNKIILCYKEWQPAYDEFKNSISGIEFHDGILEMSSLNKNFTNVIIFDDLMNECLSSESIMNLFTVGSHHKNTGVFFITHNIFSKGKFARDISLNAQYLIIFKNPRDPNQFNVLARQLFPTNSKFLIESFEEVCKRPHGYLLIDLNQGTETKNMIQTGILPGQLRILYTKK